MKNIYYGRNRSASYAKHAAAALLLCVLLLQSGCARRSAGEPLTASGYKLNTYVTLQVYDDVDPALLTEALALCDRYELVFSRTEPGSEIYRLNEAAAAAPLSGYPLSEELRLLLETALPYAERSRGAFDITVEPLSSLWDFHAAHPAVPDDALIQKNLNRVGYDNMKLTGNGLSFDTAGMGLDTGAAAKGFIADRMKDYLTAHGVEHAVISLGGNVLCIGSRPDGSPFRVGIRKPFSDTGDTAMVLGIEGQSVVTAGTYERYFEQDGRLYHHIIDPHTGYPYDNGIASVTVVTGQSVMADILSTACFAMGEEAGIDLIESLPGTEAAYLKTDGSVLYSSGFEDYILK